MKTNLERIVASIILLLVVLAGLSMLFCCILIPTLSPECRGWIGFAGFMLAAGGTLIASSLD